MPRPDLAWLLAPLPPPVFFEEYYERRVLHLGDRGGGYYAGLFAARDAEAWLWQQETRLHTLIRVSRGGEVVRAPDNPERGYRDWLFGQYEAGGTIITHALDRTWVPVALLQRALEPALPGRVHINAYLTPPGAQGFAAHFDTHDTFILQTAGRKRWRLYHSPIELPLAAQSRPIRAAELGPPALERVLAPGDLLYVPRGVIHEALTEARASIHLTAGLHPFQWRDVLEEAIAWASEADVELRRSVGAAERADPARLGRELAARLRACAERADGEAVAGRLERRFLAGLQVLPGGQLADPADFEDLDDGRWLERQPGVVCQVSREGGRARLDFPGTGARAGLAAPLAAEPALRFLAATGRPFALAELPGPLSAASKRVLARRLLRAGLLRLAGDGGGGNASGAAAPESE